MGQLHLSKTGNMFRKIWYKWDDISEGGIKHHEFIILFIYYQFHCSHWKQMLIYNTSESSLGVWRSTPVIMVRLSVGR